MSSLTAVVRVWSVQIWSVLSLIYPHWCAVAQHFIRGLFANKIKYPGEILEKVVFDKIGIPECFSKRCDGSTKLLTLTLRNERKTKIIVFPFP